MAPDDTPAADDDDGGDPETTMFSPGWTVADVMRSLQLPDDDR